MRSPAAASRSRIRGWRTPTGPMPVMISRSGRCPWRTTRRRPASVLRSECRCRKSATSASTACVSRARAPLRKISVSESMKVSGCASLMTLLSVMAYHSFSGEVEASNTPHDTPPYPFMPSPTSALSSPKNTSANVRPTEGYILEVDGKFKSEYESSAAAMKVGLEVKTKYPHIQVKVYDAKERTWTPVELSE